MANLYRAFVRVRNRFSGGKAPRPYGIFTGLSSVHTSGSRDSDLYIDQQETANAQIYRQYKIELGHRGRYSIFVDHDLFCAYRFFLRNPFKNKE